MKELLPYYAFFLLFILALGFVGFTMFATHLLGPKRISKIKNENFECGIESVGNARHPFTVKYFLVALLFVIFDVEVILMYPWAMVFRELEIEGLFSMFLFVFILGLGYFYIIKKNAFKWE